MHCLKMWAIPTDRVAWSVCVCVSVRVCLLVMFFMPAKTAELNEISVGLT